MSKPSRQAKIAAALAEAREELAAMGDAEFFAISRNLPADDRSQYGRLVRAEAGRRERDQEILDARESASDRNAWYDQDR